MTARLLFLILYCYLVCPVPARAQLGQEWPRHPVSGNFVFDGLLSWPVDAATPAQQRAWVRRWYTTNLTEERPNRPATSDTTFAGLSNWAYLDSVSYPSAVPSGEDSLYYRVIWRLLYEVKLTSTPAGLAYRLSNFECAEIVYDASSSDRLEATLVHYPLPMAVFHRRLRWALAHWQVHPRGRLVPRARVIPPVIAPNELCPDLERAAGVPAPGLSMGKGASPIGTWRLESIHHAVKPLHGQAWCWDAPLASGEKGMTLTRKHRYRRLHYGRALDAGTYAFFGDSLNIHMGEGQLFRGRIGELTPSRLVIRKQIRVSDDQYDITETYVRTRPHRLFQQRPRANAR